MEFVADISRFFEDGGAFMYPIAVVLVLATAVGLERLFFLWKSLRQNRKFWATVSPYIAQLDLAQVEQLVSGNKSAVACLLSRGIEQSKVDSRRSELEIATDDGLMELLPVIERRTHYLSTFSNVSTLLGLLGTVLGLIGAFGALGSADPVEKAAMLSAGISEAMSCTAFGLMVAIPSLLAHAYLQSRTIELTDVLESAASRFVTVVARRNAVVA